MSSYCFCLVSRNVFSFTQQRGLFGQFPNQSVVSSGQMKRPNAISAAIMRFVLMTVSVLYWEANCRLVDVLDVLSLFSSK